MTTAIFQALIYLQQPYEVDNIIIIVQIRKGEAMGFSDLSKLASGRAEIWSPGARTEAPLPSELVCVCVCVCVNL